MHAAGGGGSRAHTDTHISPPHSPGESLPPPHPQAETGKTSPSPSHRTETPFIHSVTLGKCVPSLGLGVLCTVRTRLDLTNSKGPSRPGMVCVVVSAVPLLPSPPISLSHGR